MMAFHQGRAGANVGVREARITEDRKLSLSRTRERDWGRNIRHSVSKDYRMRRCEGDSIVRAERGQKAAKLLPQLLASFPVQRTPQAKLSIPSSNAAHRTFKARHDHVCEPAGVSSSTTRLIAPMARKSCKRGRCSKRITRTASETDVIPTRRQSAQSSGAAKASIRTGNTTGRNKVDRCDPGRDKRIAGWRSITPPRPPLPRTRRCSL